MNENQVVFAIAPNGTGDGVPMLILGVSREAWRYIRDGKTSQMDLTKVGIPWKIMMFGGNDVESIKKTVEQAAFQHGAAGVLDESRRDFAIEAKK